MIAAALVSLAVVAMYIWQDAIVDCPDGARYTSRRPQPYPFHRRFCGWPKQPLIVVSIASLVALGTLMGSWKGALLLTTLPGAWFIATRPTTVDAPCMLLALSSALAIQAHHPIAALLLTTLSGFVHERGPVFAALYAWNPLLLVGLLGVQWWRRPAPPDEDIRVGHGFVHSLIVHRRDHDWLGLEQTVFALRGLPFFAAGFGLSLAGWLTLAFAYASRITGSDFGRFVFWAAPAVVRDLPDMPAWMVLAHAVTFRRMG